MFIKRVFLIGFLVVCLPLGQPKMVAAAGAAEAGASAQVRSQEDGQRGSLDTRFARLELFLDSKNSPLVNYAGDFIFFADQFAIDWRLLPAIAGIESGFGKVIPSGSYNAYGWGNGRIYFSDWPESIETVSRSLAEKYYQKGLNTPEKIGSVYAPFSSDWAGKIRTVMGQIDQTSLPLEPKF
ncbi:MAG: hypothetical protein PHX72_02095 [Candidatus Shapirobacteria bacterium]|nr:hypothetical protein [Candidatus Shapirobacteria bacterium]